MLERGKIEREIFEIVDTESLMPEGHLLRKIDAAVDLNKIYDYIVQTMADPVRIRKCCPKWFSFSICMALVLCAVLQKKYGQISIIVGSSGTVYRKI